MTQMSRTRQLFGALLLGAIVTATALPTSLFGAMAPLLEKGFGVGDVAIGAVVAEAFACAAVTGVLSGLIADRGSTRAVMVGGCMTLALGMLSVAAFVSTWKQLLVAAAVCGCANGAVLPIGYRWIWDHVNQSRTGTAFGMMQAGFPAATMLAGVVAPYMSRAWGWRAPFAAGGILMIGLMITLVFLDRPAADRPPAMANRPLDTNLNSDVDSRTRPVLGLFVAASVLANSATSALGAYFVVSAVHSGDAPSLASVMYGVGGFLCIAARVSLGFYVDRASRPALSVLRVLLLCGALGVLILAIHMSSLLLIAAVLGLGIGWGWSGLLTQAVTRTFRRVPGKAAGLVMTTGGSAGAAIGPALFGLAVGSFGYTPAWTLAAGALVVAALLLRRVDLMPDH